MLFCELPFLYIFLPVCLILHLLFKNTAAKNTVLLLMSLLFYAWGEPVYVLLMIAVSAVSYGLGLAIERRRGRLVLALSVMAVLAPLIFFKYSGFLAGIVGLSFKGPSLPIGISFYTFQIVSYLADVYWCKAKAQKNPFYFMLYVSLFPQLIAGPIVRYVDVEREINDRAVTAAAFTDGVCRFLTGLGKKVLLADTLDKAITGILYEPVSASMSELGVIGAWGVMLCFAFQIYFDFSGYSDMAIGLGKMLGFNYCENFDHPYISTSIKDFWRRWHISMSTFFRDYIYIPMGGNRRRQLFNMLVVWAATGLWHGAGWNFVLWGLYFFVLLVIEKYLFKKLRLPKVIAIPATFALVLLGWVFFHFENLGQAWKMFAIMFGFGKGGDVFAIPILLAAVPVLSVCVIGSTPLPVMVKNAVMSRVPAWVGTALRLIFVVAMLLGCTAMIVSSTYSPFMYFKF